MPLRGNALLRRIRRHRSMTTLYRSSLSEAPLRHVSPTTPRVSSGTQVGATRVVAQLMPARADLPFGQLIPAQGARLSTVPGLAFREAVQPERLPPQLGEIAQRPVTTTLSPGPLPAQPTVEAPVASREEAAIPPEPAQAPAGHQTTPAAPGVQREPSQSPAPQPRPDSSADTTSDFPWISGSEWNRLKQFAEGHQETLARQSATPEAIQRAEQEKAELAALEQRDAEVARRQELAREGRLPKAGITYLSPETAGTTPLPTAEAAPPLQRTVAEASERRTQPAGERPPAPPVEDQAPSTPRQPSEPVLADATQQPAAPVQAKPMAEATPATIPPATPIEPAVKHEASSTPAQPSQIQAESTSPDRFEIPSKSQEPVEPADHEEPLSTASSPEETPKAEPGGIRRLFDAARSLLRREEGEAQEPGPSEAVKPAAVQRHEVEEDEEPGVPEAIQDVPPTTTPAVQRQIADIVGPQPPESTAAPEDYIEPMVEAAESHFEAPVQRFQPVESGPAEQTAADAQEPQQEPAQEYPMRETPAREAAPTFDRLAPAETVAEAPVPQEAGRPDHPVGQVGPGPVPVQRTAVQPLALQPLAEPPTPSITPPATPAAGVPVEDDRAQSTAQRAAQSAAQDAAQSAAQSAAMGTAQPPAAPLVQPQAPRAGIETPGLAPRAVEPPSTPPAPAVQWETAEVADSSAFEAIDETGYDADDAETMIQPVPLESAWPVQQVEPPKAAAAPRVAKEPAGPAVQRKPAGIDQAGEHVHETIKDIAPEETTDSSIELITPRRPRPTLPPKVEAAPAGIQREAEADQPEEATPPTEAARLTEQPQVTPELQTKSATGIGEIQRAEQPPLASSTGQRQAIPEVQPAMDQAADLPTAVPQPDPADQLQVRQQESVHEKPLAVSEPSLAEATPAATLAPAAPVQLTPDLSASGMPSPVRGPEAKARKEPSEPYLVPTPIGDLPSDLWEMLGERPPAPRPPAAQPSVAGPQTVQREVEVQPQQLVTEVFRAPDLQRDDVQTGQTESAGAGQAEEAADEGGEEKKSEVDVDELARKVYPEIRRRLEIEWERGRGRFR